MSVLAQDTFTEASTIDLSSHTTDIGAEGRTPKDIKRCLKRFLVRRLFRLLEAADIPT